MDVQVRESALVLLVDDLPAVRQGLALLLGHEGFATHEADSFASAADSLARSSPSLALVPLWLGDEAGLSLIAELRARGVPVVVHSLQEGAAEVAAALAAGARAYVSRREPAGILFHALREAAAGRRYLSPRVAAGLADSLSSGRDARPQAALSERERQVYECLGRGDAAHEIAEALGVSARTVESYCARIIEKLGLEGMSDLRHHAIRSSSAPRP